MRTTRTTALPRFYAQPIGSLPRPKVVIDMLGRRDRAAMDDAVRFAIRLQETAGLDVVSDGEWRRTQYIDEFLDRIGGFERSRRFEHAGEVKFLRVAVRRISAAEPVFASDARFLALNTERVTKFALPSPFLIAIRYWHEDYSRDAYPTYRHLLDHLAEILVGSACGSGGGSRHRAGGRSGADVFLRSQPDGRGRHAR